MQIMQKMSCFKEDVSCTIQGQYLHSDALLVSLHDLRFKRLIYLIPTLYAAPQLSLCLKQAVSALVSLMPPS